MKLLGTRIRTPMFEIKVSIYNINTQYQASDRDIGSTEWDKVQVVFFLSHLIELLSHLISPTTISKVEEGKPCLLLWKQKDLV